MQRSLHPEPFARGGMIDFQAFCVQRLPGQLEPVREGLAAAGLAKSVAVERAKRVAEKAVRDAQKARYDNPGPPDQKATG